MSGPKLGVCYFPEHWDEDDWPKDFKAMAKEGIGVVRMGEFAWSVYEPKPAKQGKLKLDWMRQCLDLAHSHKIEVVLCTPTATPPKWLVDSMPDMLGTDMDGNTRKFGSRRHYSFAHEGYRGKCKGITEALAKGVRRTPRRHSLADRQRVWLPRHRPVLWRERACSVQGLARPALPVAGRAEQELGQRLLVHEL